MNEKRRHSIYQTIRRLQMEYWRPFFNKRAHLLIHISVSTLCTVHCYKLTFESYHKMLQRLFVQIISFWIILIVIFLDRLSYDCNCIFNEPEKQKKKEFFFMRTPQEEKNRLILEKIKNVRKDSQRLYLNN